MILSADNPPQYVANNADSLNWLPTKSELKTLKKSNFKCISCGFESRPSEACPSGYIELLKADKTEQPFCSLCAQSKYLGRSVNGRSNVGLIIYCPSLSQGQIVHLARTLFTSRFLDDENSEKSRSLINKISLELVEPVVDVIPDFEGGTSREFASILNSLSPLAKEKIEPFLRSLRFWPYEDSFSLQIKYWQSLV